MSDGEKKAWRRGRRSGKYDTRGKDTCTIGEHVGLGTATQGCDVTSRYRLSTAREMGVPSRDRIDQNCGIRMAPVGFPEAAFPPKSSLELAIALRWKPSCISWDLTSAQQRWMTQNTGVPSTVRGHVNILTRIQTTLLSTA